MPPAEKDRKSSGVLQADFSADISNPEDSARRATEQALEAERKKRMEERFFWILGFVLYTDVLFFAQMEHWAGPVVIGIFQMFGLAIAADRCGIKEVMPMFDKITSTMRGMVARKD